MQKKTTLKTAMLLLSEREKILSVPRVKGIYTLMTAFSVINY